MKATQLLHNLGQSLWLDNITRDMLANGALQRYIDELSVTGLTSNPTIFEQAIKNSSSPDSPSRSFARIAWSYAALPLIACSKIVGFEVRPVT